MNSFKRLLKSLSICLCKDEDVSSRFRKKWVEEESALKILLKRKKCRWELLRFRNDVKYIFKTFEGIWNVWGRILRKRESCREKKIFFRLLLETSTRCTSLNSEPIHIKIFVRVHLTQMHKMCEEESQRECQSEEIKWVDHLQRIQKWIFFWWVNHSMVPLGFVFQIVKSYTFDLPEKKSK